MTKDTTPEAVDRVRSMVQSALVYGDFEEIERVPLEQADAMIAALSAALEVERASHTATLKDAQDECARAEAAEAEVARLRDEMRRAANDMQDYLDDDTGTAPIEDARDRLRAALQKENKT
jgi:hypothetical protein